MAKRITLSQLRTNIRNIGEWRSAYIGDSELNTYINQSCYKFYALMASLDPLRYIKQSVVSVSSGTSEYNLPDDFFKTVGIAVENDDQDGYHVIDSFKWEERYNTDLTSTKTNTKYIVKGSSGSIGDTADTQDGYHILQLMPVPTYSANILVDYLPAFTDLSNDADLFDAINGIGLAWVTNDVAIDCCAKEETDPSVYIKKRDDAEKILVASAQQDMLQTKTSAASNTLHGLQRAVRARGSWAREDFSDTELTILINEALQKYYSMMVALDPLRYTKQTVLSVTSGTSIYNLPADFFKTTGVAIENDNQDGYHVIDSFKWDERYNTSYSSTKQGTKYLIRGLTKLNASDDGYSTIQLYPTPGFTANLLFDYVPEVPALFLDSDTLAVDTVNGLGEEWIIADSAVKCAVKKGQDPAPYVASREDVTKILTASAKMDMLQTTSTASSNSLQGLQRAIRGRGKEAWAREQFSDTELTEYINSSIHALWDIIIAQDQSHLLSSSDITVSSGTRAYSLPADFYRLVGVAVQDSDKTDGYSVLEKFNWEERYDELSDGYQYTRYQVRGTQIHFLPTPDWSGTVKLDYIYQPTELTSPADTINVGSGYWLEWVILDCCIKCSAAAGSDPSVFMAQRKDVEARISQNTTRDITEEKTSSVSNSLRGLQRAVSGRGSWSRDALSLGKLTEFINSSIAALRDILIIQDPTYFISRSDISVVSGTRSYDLPSDFYKLIGVAVSDTSNPDGYAVLDRFDWDERYDYTLATQQWDTKYEVRGTQIHFHPLPTWTDTVRIEYIPTFTALTAPTDTFAIGSGYWLEWVILDACVKCCAATGMDPSVFLAQLQKVEKNITDNSERDVGKPRTVTDVRRRRKYRFSWRSY